MDLLLNPALYSCSAPGGRRSIDEPVPQADNRLDLPSGVSELSAKAADVDIDRARFDHPFVAPDTLQQPVPRHDAILVLHQIPEQFELAPRQPDRIAVDADRHRVEVRQQMIAPIRG